MISELANDKSLRCHHYFYDLKKAGERPNETEKVKKT